jgi:hypothetical protein
VRLRAVIGSARKIEQQQTGGILKVRAVTAAEDDHV